MDRRSFITQSTTVQNYELRNPTTKLYTVLSSETKLRAVPIGPAWDVNHHFVCPPIYIPFSHLSIRTPPGSQVTVFVLK